MRYPETATMIRSARLRRGLSQERAAVEVGCSRLQFIRWEQGVHRPNPDGLGAKLVAVLGIDSTQLAAADEDDEESSMPLQRDILEQLHAAIGIALGKTRVRA